MTNAGQDVVSDSRDRPANQMGAQITAEMLSHGASALLLSGYRNEFMEITPEQAVREVLEAMGLPLHQDR